MPDRGTGLGNYRYAYNGMETDSEVTGDYGNSYTTEFRQYDPRLMRWKSLDPLMHQFPWMSPYVAFNNNPIWYTDPYGLEGEPINGGDIASSQKQEEFLGNVGGENGGLSNGQEVFFTHDNGKVTRTSTYMYNDGSWSLKVKTVRNPGAGGKAGRTSTVDHGVVMTGTKINRGEEAPPVVENQGFAIYVAYPNATASIGSADNSEIAKEGRGRFGNRQLPVGHTGVIIGSPDGTTQYFDFGRFAGHPDGGGITRNFSVPSATFGSNGIVSNASELVNGLYGAGSYFSSSSAYSNPVIGVYSGLHFESMFTFANGHGTKSFGFGAGQSYCTKFVHDVIRAGGGTMPVIADIIHERMGDLLKLWH